MKEIFLFYAFRLLENDIRSVFPALFELSFYLLVTYLPSLTNSPAVHLLVVPGILRLKNVFPEGIGSALLRSCFVDTASPRRKKLTVIVRPFRKRHKRIFPVVYESAVSADEFIALEAEIRRKPLEILLTQEYIPRFHRAAVAAALAFEIKTVLVEHVNPVKKRSSIEDL